MSSRIALKAEVREGAGKGTARALRREDKIPAVIYGNKQSPVTITMNLKELDLEYHRGHLFTTLIDIDVDGKKELVLTRDVQTHVVTDEVLHADFLRVSPKTKIAVNIPVHFVGHDESPALNAKGILNVVRHEVELLCSAMNIPEYLEINLAGKEFGDSVRISDAAMPEGTTPTITDRDFTIATLVEPKKAADADEEETAEAGEGEEASSDSEEETTEE